MWFYFIWPAGDTSLSMKKATGTRPQLEYISMALLKPLELNKAVRPEVLAFGVFKRQNTAESTKFGVAPSAGEKNVIFYEKLSKIGVGLYSNICLPFQFCEKEREGQELLRGPKQKKTTAVCDMSCLLEDSFGDVSKNKLQTPFYSLSLLR